MNKWLQGLNWWWIHLLASGISVSALSSKKVAMPQRSFWPWEGTDPCDRTHPPRWEQMTHRRLGRGFHWPSCNPVSCHNLQTWTVAQRYAVTCQSHIKEVLGWDSDPGYLTTTLSCLPWGFRGHVSPLCSQTAVFLSGPGECICSNSTKRTCHLQATLPSRWKKEAQKKHPAVALPSSRLGQCTQSSEKFHLWFSITKLLI